MMSSNGGIATSRLALFVAVIASGCGRDSAIGPASPDAALRLEAVSATQMEGTVGEPVNPTPTVVVRSETGQPVAGIKVRFTPTHQFVAPPPGGPPAYADFVTNGIAITDSRGVASPGDWTLGTMMGLHGLEASILDANLSAADSGTGRVIAFRAEAGAAAPALLLLSSGDNQVGLPADEIEPPTARVHDRFGNGVSGVTVTFAVVSGGGSLARTRVESQRGSAWTEKWTLGPYPGLNSVVASAPGLNSVTFRAQALDAGAITWYDLVPQSVRFIVSGSIALGEKGIFELSNVETGDAFPGEWRERQFGTYTLAGTKIVLTYSTGGIEEGTLMDDSLSFVHTKLNWVGTPPEVWKFVKRE